jgi:methylated-DNA-[protein]-cysteine S-methyltransferase
MKTYFTYMESPIDRLMLTSDGEALTGVYMLDQRYEPSAGKDCVESDDATPFAEAKKQLCAFFAGDRDQFDLPLAPAGTPFQLKVWSELSRIPYGQTISYGELAKRVGNANASRAVGLANGRNPLPIIVPCHRVIGANGKLTGFGGGLWRKEKLLALESGVGTLLASSVGSRG